MRGQKHGHKGVFSEEFGRTPIRLTPGCPEIGESPQISFSAKCLWQSLQRLRKPIYTEWPKLQLPCHRAIMAEPLEAGGQDMEQEPPDEFDGIEGHEPSTVAMGLIFPPKGHPPVLQR